MRAYSSIAHTGYMLSGSPPTGRRPGLEGLLYYGAAYAFMNLGAFAVVAALQKRTVSPRSSTPSLAWAAVEPLLRCS